MGNLPFFFFFKGCQTSQSIQTQSSQSSKQPSHHGAGDYRHHKPGSRQHPRKAPSPEHHRYGPPYLQTTPVYQGKNQAIPVAPNWGTLLNKHTHHVAYLTWKEALLNIAVKLSLQLNYWICTNISLQNKKKSSLVIVLLHLVVLFYTHICKCCTRLVVCFHVCTPITCILGFFLILGCRENTEE